MRWRVPIGTSAIAPAGDGGFFVGGSTTSDGGTTPFVSRLNGQGGITWTQAVSGNNGSPSYLAVDGSGRVWVLGFGLEPITYQNEPTRGHSWLALVASDGRVLWQQQGGGS